MKELIDYLNLINEKHVVLSLLNWELDTIAPEKSYDYYVDLISKKSKELLEMTTSDKYIELLNNYIDSDDFNKLEEYKKLYFLDLKDNYEKEKRIPKEFYKEFVKQTNTSKIKWEEAKSKKDYSIFKPYLEKNIEMTKELYKYKDPNSINLYDSMLDDYEKGITSKQIDNLFEGLKERIIPIIKKLKPIDLKSIEYNYSKEELINISEFLLDYIGFDNTRGALGVFPHGYTTTINKNDVRIAFNRTDNIFDHISTIVHEGGHGIFEQYGGKSFEELDICNINTIALHESQSRFYENILGRNINFYKPIYNKLKNICNLDIELDDFIKYFNNSKPSLIRTEADELTYCMHIIIRYEIEKEIFNNNIDLDNLSKIWNQKYKDYLGVEVQNDSEGILQDMHWSDASFGYFPDYLLGTIFDGMLLETINEKVGNVDKLLSDGNIKEITKYLNENIHKYISAYNINDVAKRVCGRDLDIEPIVRYFEKKYN